VSLDRDFQVQGFDLLDEIFLVVDHMCCAVAFAGVNGLFPRCSRHDRREVKDVACHLNRSTTDSASAVDLLAMSVIVITNTKPIYPRWKARTRDLRSISQHPPRP
jgi:hypothetical protein